MAIYHVLTKGTSDPVFIALIGMETALLPLARGIDAQARPFNAQGVPIIVNDFVSMESVNDYRVPSRYRGMMTLGAINDITRLIARINRCAAGDYEAIARVCYGSLLELDAIEEEHQVHFQMTKHLMESLGIAALHALYYNHITSGKTKALTFEFVGSQLLPFKLYSSILYDKLANPVHRMGYGILINEVPKIPFEEEYEGYLETGLDDFQFIGVP